jgi:predicted GNAT family N-acyltransferase
MKAAPRIDLLPWERARAHAAPIRFSVFVEEQGVPPEIELDELDERCVHAVAFHEAVAVGTARLLPDGHIGRMAVLKEWRGRGIGSLLLGGVFELPRARGERAVMLSAQAHALAFYRAHGFVEEGAEYLEAGIRHQAMRRQL